jgi:5-(aminomethyl)-3-furanmethanol phosphate kinase
VVALMWVVKLGGGLNKDPLLPAWLELMVQLGGGRVIVVCGGGNFSDEIRQLQLHWNMGSAPTHCMSVLAMTQSAYIAHGLAPKLQLAANESSIRQVLRAGQTALWLPLELLDGQDCNPSGDGNVSSAGIALDLACRLNAERLVFIKSGETDHARAFANLGEVGTLNQRFASSANSTGIPIDVVHCADLARMRTLLHGEIKLP